MSVRARKVTATITLGAPAGAGGFLDSAVVACGSVWVARDPANEIDRIDPATNRVRARIEVASRPGGLTTGGGYVWAFHFLGRQVTRIDEHTGVKRVFTIPDVAGSGIVFGGDAIWLLAVHAPADAWWVAAGAGSLWVAEANYDRVVRVDADRLGARAEEAVERRAERGWVAHVPGEISGS